MDYIIPYFNKSVWILLRSKGRSLWATFWIIQIIYGQFNYVIDGIKSVACSKLLAEVENFGIIGINDGYYCEYFMRIFTSLNFKLNFQLIFYKIARSLVYPFPNDKNKLYFNISIFLSRKQSTLFTFILKNFCYQEYQNCFT